MGYVEVLGNMFPPPHMPSLLCLCPPSFMHTGTWSFTCIPISICACPRCPHSCTPIPPLFTHGTPIHTCAHCCLCAPCLPPFMPACTCLCVCALPLFVCPHSCTPVLPSFAHVHPHTHWCPPLFVHAPFTIAVYSHCPLCLHLLLFAPMPAVVHPHSSLFLGLGTGMGKPMGFP
jgi:hypothetical protein